MSSLPLEPEWKKRYGKCLDFLQREREKEKERERERRRRHAGAHVIPYLGDSLLSLSTIANEFDDVVSLSLSLLLTHTLAH